MKQKSVRELGGEIWAEIEMEQRANPHSRIAGIGWETVSELSDFVMSVLARHAGAVIVNDEDRPVTPRPYSREHERN